MGEGEGENLYQDFLTLLNHCNGRGSTAARPLGWDMHFGSRKKFCMSTITNAVVLGAIVTEVSAGPSIVAIVNLGVEELDML